MPNPTTYPAHYLWSRHFFDVWDFGAFGDGADDTQGIQGAIDAARDAGGGTVLLQEGTYLAAGLTLRSNVHIVGSGRNATTIKLKNGANTDLFSRDTSLINLAAANASSGAGTLNNFGFHHITLDGNKAGQTGGTSYVLRFYGWGFILTNLAIKGGYSGNVLCDWNGGSASPGADDMAAQIVNFKIHDCNGINWEMGGPHDTVFVNGEFYKSGSHNIHWGPNATAMTFTNVHFWGPATGNSSVNVLAEAGYALFTGCEAEGSDVAQVVILANESSWSGGHIFGAGNFGCTGIVLGQANAATAWASQIQANTGITCAGCRIDTMFSRCEGSNGTIQFANDAGNNWINATIYLNNASGLIYTGTISAQTAYQFNMSSGSLPTPDGTIAKGGGIRHVAQAQNAFRMGSRTTDYLNIDTYDTPPRFELPNGIVFKMYSDNYSTQKAKIDQFGNLNLAGNIVVGQSSSAAAIANNGTLTTSGIGEARVNPAGNVTGIILQAGVAGQQVTVVNESAFTVTFDIAGTSHVADGTSAILAATKKMDFTYDGGTSLWYHN